MLFNKHSKINNFDTIERLLILVSKIQTLDCFVKHSCKLKK